MDKEMDDEEEIEVGLVGGQWWDILRRDYTRQ